MQVARSKEVSGKQGARSFVKQRMRGSKQIKAEEAEKSRFRGRVVQKCIRDLQFTRWEPLHL